jgi:NAD(P)-dependent dehydrogenase (short-subunit alcohol dehydrogenase family)
LGSLPLAGRAAVITGASQGLGRAIAERFVRAGASVLIVARAQGLLDQVRDELAALAGPTGAQVHAVAGDVSDRGTCDRVARDAERLMPGFDILVNNAGVYGPIGTLDEVDWDEWVRALQINLFGTALMCRAVIPAMRARGYGKIVNLSGGGATAPLPRFSAYAASKAAVVRLTETLADELRDSRIDVNAVAPGALNTRLLDEVLSAGPARTGEQFYARALKQQQDGGTALDKGADLAVFLASPESDGITGRLLSAVWDDWRTLPQRREQLAKSDVYTLRRIVPEDRKGP